MGMISLFNPHLLIITYVLGFIMIFFFCFVEVDKFNPLL